MSSQLDQKELAKELAETFLDSVIHYCRNIPSGDSYFICLERHSPKEVELGGVDVKAYLEKELGKREVNKILKNADEKFWEEFNKEYEELWMEEAGATVVDDIEDIIEDGMKKVVESGNVEKIEKYRNVLNKLRNAIIKALKTQKPLSYDELKEYLLKLYKIAGLDYYDEIVVIAEAHGYVCSFFSDKDECVVDYMMNNYSSPLLDKAGRFVALELLLNRIDKILSRIDKILSRIDKILSRNT